MGIRLPNPGEAHINGVIVPEEQAYEEAARQFLMAKVPTIFPGPLVLWAWNEKAAKKATAIRHLYNTLKDCVQPGQKPMLIPMPDYRPKYPKINPEVEINPNHPNLTIWHNKIDVCLFVGVHDHLANIALKIIRGGTDCYTISLSFWAGNEDACLSIRDTTPETIEKMVAVAEKLKAQGVKSQALPFKQFKNVPAWKQAGGNGK
jgi:hypothetical protein